MSQIIKNLAAGPVPPTVPITFDCDIGTATAAANTFQGSIDKLGVASANVKEIIGTGLIDALTTLGENTSVSDLAADMEKTATYLADVIRGIGVLGDKLKNTPIIGQVFGNLNVGMIPIVGTYLKLLS